MFDQELVIRPKEVTLVSRTQPSGPLCLWQRFLNLFSTKQLTKVDEEGYSVVYYWEINWPRFFSNRDYCCHRSVQVLKNTGKQW